MRDSKTISVVTALVTSLLSSCGSGGSPPIVSVVVPPPTPTPTPTPTPAPTGVITPEVLTIGSDASTVVYSASETNEFGGQTPGEDSRYWKYTHIITGSTPSSQTAKINISFDETSGNYEMVLPNGIEGTLSLIGFSGTQGQIASYSAHDLIDSSGGNLAFVEMPVPYREGYPYTYSHFGSWFQGTDGGDQLPSQTFGWFVYGYETPTDAVPRTGNAQYSAELRANSPLDPFIVSGPVELVFDFGAGTLSGQMRPSHYTNGFYTESDYDYGIYQFANTLYSIGSPKYSGMFSKDGDVLAQSWFNGSLTGPGAEEVIGQFAAPFVRDGYHGFLTGVWIGKRD